MELTKWRVVFKPDWDLHFKDFDKSIQEHVLKKIEKMEQSLQARGLHSLRFQIEEVGQYRIAFIQDEKTHTKYIHFVGNHKQYEKWYREQ
ncbi:MAG: hypothetical protein Q7S92_03400 [Candidatus Diapherotrites archaeon]|nr:hypothetical protein [Candidatus Diapherotrites archaeon]